MLGNVLSQRHDLFEFFAPYLGSTAAYLEPTQEGCQQLLRGVVALQQCGIPVPTSTVRAERSVPLSLVSAEEYRALLKYADGDAPQFSSDIAEFLTCGYGRLSEFGDWELPLPAQFVAWLESTYFRKDHDQQQACA